MFCVPRACWDVVLSLLPGVSLFKQEDQNNIMIQIIG
jgi:hypothetical protein